VACRALIGVCLAFAVLECQGLRFPMHGAHYEHEAHLHLLPPFTSGEGVHTNSFGWKFAKMILRATSH